MNTETEHGTSDISTFEQQARASASEWREELARNAPPTFNDQALALRKDWAAGIPYSASSAKLYENLASPNQMVTVAAPTGRGKSLLATNCAAYVIQNGGRVIWVNLEMPSAVTNERLACMLTNLSPDEVRQIPDHVGKTMQELIARRLWCVLDIVSPPRAQTQWNNMLTHCAAQGPANLIVIDGFDRVCSGLTPQEFTERCHDTAKWAADRNVCLIATSQTTRGSVDAEVIDIDNLAFSAGKGYASDTVVTLGHRIPDMLRTASVVKDRNRLFADNQVFRLAQTLSLRMEVLEVDGAIPLRKADTVYEYELVNCETLDVEGPDADVEGDSGEAEGDERGGSHTQLYHGTNGHVSIGREVFRSAIYSSRNWEALGRLFSLYERAAIEETKLQAPNTRVPITIQRGQIMTSARMLGALWGVDKSQAVRFLQQLEREGLVKVDYKPANTAKGSAETKVGTKGKVLASVVTLCHYDTNDGANPAYGRRVGTKGETKASRR